MSDYQDDTNEIAVASDETWLGLHAVVDETAKVAVAVFFGLGVLAADTAVASDQVFDRPAHLIVEEAHATSSDLSKAHAAVLVVESAQVGEVFTHSQPILHIDSAQVSDEVLESVTAIITETAQVADTVIATRKASDLLVDGAVASDFSGWFASQLVTETITASDSATGVVHTFQLITESAQIADAELSSSDAATLTVERATASDSVVLNRLNAVQLVVDYAQADGLAVSNEVTYGQTWTANTDNWGMSRYYPFEVEQLAVINGALYGVNQSGVYAIDGNATPVTGTLETGKIDFGDQLVHLEAAYLEYAIKPDPAAPPAPAPIVQMDVGTTQSGVYAAYTYTLPAEVAGELTNGRIRLGRGLRGRHFSFTLRMTGAEGHINDLSVHAARTSRRI